MAWPLKPYFLDFFLFSSQSKIKHILFKGFFRWGLIFLVTDIQNDVKKRPFFFYGFPY